MYNGTQIYFEYFFAAATCQLLDTSTLQYPPRQITTSGVSNPNGTVAFREVILYFCDHFRDPPVNRGSNYVGFRRCKFDFESGTYQLFQGVSCSTFFYNKGIRIQFLVAHIFAVMLPLENWCQLTISFNQIFKEINSTAET